MLRLHTFALNQFLQEAIGGSKAIDAELVEAAKPRYYTSYLH